MLYPCPNPTPKDKTTLTDVLARLENEPGFATFLFGKLQEAYTTGNQFAIDCVDSYLQPTPIELQDLGLSKYQQSSMRRCTDSGLLVLVKCKQKASPSVRR
jgi:hypothetical protein